MIEAIKQARQIIWRYRHETPLGKQPHMIAHEADEVIERIDQALKTKDEPVAWRLESGQAVWFERTDPEASSALPNDVTAIPLYTTPQPQREWVGLTDEEANQLWESTDSDWELMKRTEAKLKEKNILKRKNYE